MSDDQLAYMVTGGTGLLGTHVLNALRARHPARPLIIASRGSPSSGGSMPASVRLLRLDLTEDFILRPVVHTIIHIAGEKRDKFRMESVNHHGTRRLVEAAVQAGVRRFVCVSSVGVYGARPHAGLVTETFPHMPRNPYEASKDAGEKCVRELCSRFGMEFVVVQPSNVIGSMTGRSYPLLGLMRMVQKGWFTWFGATEPWINYVAVEDVAAAVVVAAERAPSGHTFILNTPERLSNMVRWISEELGVPTPQRRLPLWLGQAAVGLGSTVARLSNRSMLISREKLLELTNTTMYDGSAFTHATGFDYPAGVHRMIKNLVSAYRREGKV
jgi:UDP-glucose 4-epimerase